MAVAKKKKKLQGPPCVLFDLEATKSKHPWMKSQSVKLFVLQCLVDASALMHQTKIIRTSLYDIHNPQAVEKVIIIDIPRSPPNLNLPLVHPLKLVTQSDFILRTSPVMCNAGRIYPQELTAKPNKPVDKQKHSLESLCMTEEQLAAFQFPPEGVKLDLIGGTNSGYAIDCEMCKSGAKSVLTRFAVTKFETSEVIIDQLVKPDEEITDYVTQYSGITEEMLKPVTFGLKDAQELLRRTIGSTDILIGHSLENDLRVLKIQHSRIVDTALLFPHIRGFPFRNSLRYIARKYLQSVIQDNTNDGHNPIVDAETCTQLVKLVMEHGPQFGDIRSESTALSTWLKKFEVSTTYVGSSTPEWDAYGSADHVCKTSVQECVDAALASRSKFTCVTLDPTLSGFDAASMKQAVVRISEAQPFRTAVAVIAGPPTTLYDEFAALNKKKTEFKWSYKSQKWDEIENPWMLQDENRMKQVKEELCASKLYIDVTINPEEVADLPKRVKEVYEQQHPPVEVPHMEEPRMEPSVEESGEESSESSSKRIKLDDMDMYMETVD